MGRRGRRDETTPEDEEKEEAVTRRATTSEPGAERPPVFVFPAGPSPVAPQSWRTELGFATPPVGSGGTPPPTGQEEHAVNKTRLALESLDARTLPSATLANGILTVTGTAGKDAIVVT